MTGDFVDFVVEQIPSSILLAGGIFQSARLVFDLREDDHPVETLALPALAEGQTTSQE